MNNLARTYTDAWNSHDPAKVAGHYVSGGTIAINGGEPTPMTDVAQAFISAFPDIEVLMDDLVFKDGTVEYHWTFTGTSSDTGKHVRISGFEEWTLGDDGRVAYATGTYDQEEYDRQLAEGVSE